ncbi:MAG: YfhO family protein [Planctomycetes bacterium]|nr:YfhO family protein [Planctomycetota bacterium]
MKKGCLAAILYLLFAALMLSYGLFQGGEGICLDALYTVKPWDQLGFEERESCNPANAHQAFFIYPWMKYTFDYLGEGHIPFWTHLTGGGNPFMGNLTCACFYPLNLLGLVVSPQAFWLLAGFIKLFLAAILTYALLRIYHLRFLSAFIGGLSFGFCGFQVCWLNHPHSNVIFFLPALLISVEYFLKKRTGFFFFLNAFLIGMQILGGSPEVSFLLCVTWALYLIYRIRQEEGLRTSSGLKLLFSGGLCGLLGLGMVAFQFLPFLEYLVHSYGLEIRIREWGDFLNGGPGRLLSPFGFLLGLLFPFFMVIFIGLLQRKNTVFIGVWSGLLGGLCLIVAMRIGFWLGAKPHLLMQVLPELYGGPNGGCQNVGDISFSALNGGYTGVITAFLAFYTFVAPCKRRPVPFFLLLFLFSFGTAHSIPWLNHMLKCVPFLGWIHNSSLLGFTAFSIAIIAPFGLEDLVYRAANIQGRSAAVAGVIGAAFVIGWAIVVAGWNFFETGVDLMEADRDPNPRVKITAPQHGSKHNGLKELVIQGRAAPEAELVRATLDKFFVGDMRTVAQKKLEALSTQEGPIAPPEFNRSFAFNYSLDTVDEGTYKISLGPYDAQAQEEMQGKDWVDIRIVRPKTVTDKDFLIICLSLACFLFLLGRRFPVSVRVVSVLGVLAVDLICFGYGYNKATRPGEAFPATDVTTFLQTQPVPYRIFAETGIMPPNTNLPYGIEHMEWDDRMGIAGYFRFCNFIKLDHLAKPTEFDVYNFDLMNPLFDFLGVNFILVKQNEDLSRLGKFELVHDGDVRIYRNLRARERAFVVGDWINWGDLPVEEVLHCDLATLPVFLEAPPIERGGSGTAKIMEYSDQKVRIEVETQGQSLLVLTDNHFPGWEAYVDDVRTPILVTTGTFRAVPIKQEGRHEVVFKYRPKSFYWGLLLTFMAMGISLLLWLWPGLVKRCLRKPEEITSSNLNS